VCMLKVLDVTSNVYTIPVFVSADWWARVNREFAERWYASPLYQMTRLFPMVHYTSLSNPEPNAHSLSSHSSKLYLQTNQLHRAESFLRSRQSLSYSKSSQHFMEPEGSLRCSQEPSTGFYPEPDQSNPYHLISCLRSILILSYLN
jgi:hypothetical protein